MVKCVRFDQMAELGKLSQGKPTVIPPELIAGIQLNASALGKGTKAR